MLLLILALAIVAGIVLYVVLSHVNVVPPPPPPPPPPPGNGPKPLPFGRHLTLINQSKFVGARDIAAYVAAQQTQIDRDFSPAWGGSAIVDTAPGGWPVYLQDVSDVPGALGYHDVDAAGVPFGRVFVQTSLQAGLSWESVASHEVLEILGDADTFTTDVGEDGCAWYQEVGDPCEDLSYFVGGVEVSDFVFPSWFTVGGAGPFDFLGVLDAPFSVTPGGYAIADCDGTIVTHAGKRHADSVDHDFMAPRRP